ncbi:MAG: hypothetical protein ACRBB6_04180 [Neptuniibacter sp.]
MTSRKLIECVVVGVLAIIVFSIIEKEVPNTLGLIVLPLFWGGVWFVLSLMWGKVAPEYNRRKTIKTIKELTELKDMGVLSESEYNQKVSTLKQDI